MLVALLIVAALAALAHLQLESQRRSHRAAEVAWERERRELLNRVQRPEHVPVLGGERFEWPEEELDEIEKVGTIALPSELALED